MLIDLRSDTITRPGPAMRRAMAEADVADDERDGDPTVGRLERLTAELLGKEAALFFPSGVMANQAAVWLHTRPGTEVLLDADAHIIHWEAAGAAALSGVQVRPVPASEPGGVMRAGDLRRAIRPASRFAPAPTLVCVENTHNGAGGRVTRAADLRAIADVAREHGLPVHMDGARLWNASIASGDTLADLAGAVDTVMVAFSKGLGGPIGAAVAGTRAHVNALWGIRKRLGGAMRQAGIVAAGALYGLEHHRERLVEDHAHAAAFARRVDGEGGARVVTPETNIVMVDLPAPVAADVVARAKEQGVLLTLWSPTRVRAVTHLDVSADQVRTAADVTARVLAEIAARG